MPKALSSLISWWKEDKMASWLAVFPAFFPTYLVKLQILGLPSNLLEVLIFATFVCWFLEKVWFVLRLNKILVQSRSFFKQYWKFIAASLLFLMISLVAVMIVPVNSTLIDGVTVYESKKVAWGIWKGWIALPYVYLLMLTFSIRKKELLFKSIYAYVFSALPLVIWAFIQYLTSSFITADGRASGPFVNANYLAMYLAPAVVALWIMIVRGILLGFRPIRFIIGAFLAVMYSIALLMTQSYGAMLAVIMTLLLFMVEAFRLHKKDKKAFELDILKKISYFLLTIFLVVMFSAVLLFVNTEKWKLFTQIQTRSSSSVRLEVYQIAGNFIVHNPLLGIGLGQFEPKYNLEAPQILGHAPYEWVMIHPHNVFLATWLNLGLAGLLLLLFLLYATFRKYWLIEEYEEKFFRMIGVAMLLVMLLHGLVDTYFFKNDLAMLFWLVMAICWLPLKKNTILKNE